MRHYIFIIAAFSLALDAVAQNQLSDYRILGLWITPEKAEVEIYLIDGMYQAKISKLPSGAKENMLDENNPDEKLKSRTLIGMDILMHFKYTGKNRWSKGKVYLPEEGKTYAGELELIHEQLKVSACISFYCDSEYWIRKH